MNNLVKRGFLIISILTVLGCLTFGMVLLMLPRQAGMVTDYLFDDAGRSFQTCQPIRHEAIERLGRLLSGSMTAGRAGSVPDRVTEEEINQEIQYLLQQKDDLIRGVERAEVRFGPERFELLCRIDARHLREPAPGQSRVKVPELLAGPRTIYLKMTPYQDLAGRWCLRTDSCRVDGLPIPPAEVAPFLVSCWPAIRYELEAGFILPDSVRKVEVTPRTLALRHR